MKFVPLTRSILLNLQRSGYNILTSKNTAGENPTWYPGSVPDVRDYLLRLDGADGIISLKEPAVLVIEDALQHVRDEQLGGEVFIEDNHRQVLQYKLHVYDKRYQFLSSPENYDFAFDPQRLLFRNHAVHSGDHMLYLTYLGFHYPEFIIDEMRDLEDLTRSLICLDAAHARDWFMDHDVAVMESDIWICDEDAILKALTVQEEEIWSFTDEDEDLVYNILPPQDILPLRDLFWIDPRMD
jgi:hypothetical protein